MTKKRVKDLTNTQAPGKVINVTASIQGPKGFYPSPGPFTAGTLKGSFEFLLANILKLPEECDGQKLADWHTISITITREACDAPGAAEDISGVEQHPDGEHVRITDPAVFDQYVRACGWEGGTADWEKDTGVDFELEVKGKWFTFMGGPGGTRVFLKGEGPCPLCGKLMQYGDESDAERCCNECAKKVG